MVIEDQQTLGSYESPTSVHFNLLYDADPNSYDDSPVLPVESSPVQDTKEFRYESTSKVKRYAWNFFSVIFPLILLYRGIHAFIGSGILHDAIKKDLRNAPSALEKYNCERLSLIVDGVQVDAKILRRKGDSSSSWITHALGSDRPYALEMNQESTTDRLMEKTSSNAILFNYPGVGKSKGFANRDLLVATQRAVFDYLQHKERAKKIIAVGSSLGGAVQAEALNGYQFEKGVKAVSVKLHSISRATDRAKKSAGSLAKAILYFFGWEMDVVKRSKTLKIPELIFQDSLRETGTELTEQSQIKHDDVLLKEETLGWHVVSENKATRKVYSYNARHCHSMDDVAALTIGNLVKQALR